MHSRPRLLFIVAPTWPPTNLPFLNSARDRLSSGFAVRREARSRLRGEDDLPLLGDWLGVAELNLFHMVLSRDLKEWDMCQTHLA